MVLADVVMVSIDSWLRLALESLPVYIFWLFGTKTGALGAILEEQRYSVGCHLVFFYNGD